MPRYPGIASDAFRHPLDREAEQALRSLPGFDAIARKFLEVTVDRPQFIYHMGNGIRVGPRQYASIYQLFREAIHSLDISPEPALFITQNPLVNAYTIGQEQPSILLTAGLLDLLDDRELLAVLAHELGHLKCGHATLTQMGIWAVYAASTIGQFTLGLGNLLMTNALLLAFFEWKRKAELSSDRAALLVTDDADVVMGTMLKLAGGTQRHGHELSLAEFRQQAQDYQALDSDGLNQVYKFFLANNLTQGLFTSHPFPVERLGYLEDWSRSEEYHRIRAGDYGRAGAVDVDPQGAGAPHGQNNAATAEAERLRREIERLQREIDRLQSR